MIKHQSLIFTIFLLFLGAWHTDGLTNEPDYQVSRITDNIQIIYGPFDLPDNQNHGFRNNVVIVSTSGGIVIFDPGGSAYAGERVVQKVKEMSKQPIVAVFNSHAHGDHWLGNEGIKRHFPEAVIYGHPAMKSKVQGPDGDFWLNTINRLTKETADGKRVVAPDKTVNDGDEVKIGDTTFLIHHTGSAHTDNDIMIEIKGEDALFMGDVVRNGLLGIMEEDASFKGNIAAIDFIVDKNFKYYIPGHGLVGNVAMPQVYRAYLAILRGKVGELYEDGMADFEMKPDVVNAVSAYEKWVGFDMRVGPHISRAYLEIEAEEFE